MKPLLFILVLFTIVSAYNWTNPEERLKIHEIVRNVYHIEKPEDREIFIDTIYKNVEMRQASKPKPECAPVPFKCETFGPSPSIPTSVHKLRPADIKVVAALGDSITAGFGAESWTLITVFTEYRGISWSIGGDEDITETVTMPNILKKYNPDLIGYSLLTGDADSCDSKLNRAVTGSRVADLPPQAQSLIEKLKADSRVNMTEDWKMVTILIGGNDLCDYCDDRAKHSPETYQNTVRQVLRTLKQGIPRLFVNLALGIDTTLLYEASSFTCDILHKFECPCSTSSDEAIRKEVSDALYRYNEKLIELAHEKEFDGDDFTVVIQPFLNNTTPPLDQDGNVDLDYFAPDCFHFSHLSHQAAGVALWNNIVEPVPTKLTRWTVGEPIECPTSNEYLYTNRNSKRINK